VRYICTTTTCPTRQTDVQELIQIHSLGDAQQQCNTVSQPINSHSLATYTTTAHRHSAGWQMSTFIVQCFVTSSILSCSATADARGPWRPSQITVRQRRIATDYRAFRSSVFVYDTAETLCHSWISCHLTARLIRLLKQYKMSLGLSTCMCMLSDLGAVRTTGTSTLNA